MSDLAVLLIVVVFFLISRGLVNLAENLSRTQR
jgi:hypothetical protein